MKKKGLGILIIVLFGLLSPGAMAQGPSGDVNTQAEWQSDYAVPRLLINFADGHQGWCSGVVFRAVYAGRDYVDLDGYTAAHCGDPREVNNSPVVGFELDYPALDLPVHGAFFVRHYFEDQARVTFTVDRTLTPAQWKALGASGSTLVADAPLFWPVSYCGVEVDKSSLYLIAYPGAGEGQQWTFGSNLVTWSDGVKFDAKIEDYPYYLWVSEAMLGISGGPLSVDNVAYGLAETIIFYEDTNWVAGFKGTVFSSWDNGPWYFGGAQEFGTYVPPQDPPQIQNPKYVYLPIVNGPTCPW